MSVKYTLGFKDSVQQNFIGNLKIQTNVEMLTCGNANTLDMLDSIKYTKIYLTGFFFKCCYRKILNYINGPYFLLSYFC